MHHQVYSSLDCHESPKAATGFACQAEGLINQAQDNDNRTPMHVGKRRKRIKYSNPCGPTMHAGTSSPVYIPHSESLREEFLEAVFEDGESFRSPCPTTSTLSRGSGNSQQANTATLSSLQSEDSESIQSPQRRIQGDDDEEHDGPYRASKQDLPGLEDTVGKDRHRSNRIVCPFHLFRKDIYCKNKTTGKKYETCSGPGWRTMHHLKLVKNDFRQTKV
ncbi:hypothetical protein L207DRAFT_305659 [Hyaloscypha variabilis F]|uniref:Uncharacterized protein n=1 Tax=Hyaloscypha variabilis (strain UAMH 11265 / GT02V1 / F) TaxID=1149755 RepID=A0A2J6RU66_HYAVF|nr:hypothetical protein L207DRAFT_305659 [Hyaloscypha variabilis F]